ncbi:MAG TPA: hypothetical protein VFS62_10125, partial [Chloroflexota bacterium]|nr:hypothetical protein [Chloroflexota bacterium]
MSDAWPHRRAAAVAAKVEEAPPLHHWNAIPDDGSTWAAVLYWARYKAFWFQAISRVLAINGAVGAILWGVDQVTGRDNETLLQIRSNLPLTLFVAALIALAYGVARMAAHLDPERPFRNAAQLVL